MIHYRQKMRDKVVALLKAADIKGVNDRVFGTLFFPQREFPLISVWPEAEKVRPEAGQYERAVQINVTVLAKATADVENDVDDYCAQIEARIDKQLGGLALDGWLADVSFERQGEAEQEYLSCTLAYVFRYVTAFYDATNSTH